MSDNINSKIYSFIQKQYNKQTDEHGIMAADLCNSKGQRDHKVDYTEFLALMKRFNDWGVDNKANKDDIIEKFWFSLEGSASVDGAIKSNDAEKIQIRIVAFQAAEEKIAAFCKDTGAYEEKLKNAMANNIDSMIDDIVNSQEEFNEGAIKAAVNVLFTDEYLMAEAKKALIDVIVKETIEEQLGQNSGELKGYNPLGDSNNKNRDEDLLGLINKALESVSIDTTDINALIQSMKDTVSNVIKGYLAAAGFETGVTPDSVGYHQSDDDTLNELQKTRLRNKLGKWKDDKVKDFDKDYRDEYKTLLENYIKDNINAVTVSEFNTYIQDPAAFFKDFDDNNIQNKIDIKKMFTTDTSELYKALKEQLGDNDIYNSLVEKLKKVGEKGTIQNIYNNICANIKDYVNEDGTLKTDLVVAAIITELYKNIQTILPYLKGLSIDELANRLKA